MFNTIYDLKYLNVSFKKKKTLFLGEILQDYFRISNAYTFESYLSNFKRSRGRSICKKVNIPFF